MTTLHFCYLWADSTLSIQGPRGILPVMERDGPGICLLSHERGQAQNLGTHFKRREYAVFSLPQLVYKQSADNYQSCPQVSVLSSSD